MNQTYQHGGYREFIVCDSKKRRIKAAPFQDRVIHHALCNIIEPIFDKRFIYDSCANRKGKGTLLALERFEKFQRKVTDNLSKEAYCLKADIRHYFKEIDRTVLLEIINKMIKCKETISLIKLILNNFEKSKGMPLGNLTSQFFANVYLNELDQFVKHKLNSRYYIRYVDDFVLLHKSKQQLILWKENINLFLREKLKLEIHPDKSKILSLSNGADFVGFKFFYGFKSIRKRNVRSFKRKLKRLKTVYSMGNLSMEKFLEITDGWFSYMNIGDIYNLRIKLFKEIKEILIGTGE